MNINKPLLKKFRYVLTVLTVFILFHPLYAMSTPSNNLSTTTQQILKHNPSDHINPSVLRLALQAYQTAKQLGQSKKDIVTIIDYSKPSNQPRLWVIDIKNYAVHFYTYVAHGRQSGDIQSNHFSDQFNSHASSIGVYLTGDTYQGKNGYSMHLFGLDKGFNDNAYDRTIVMHPAWYVSDDFLKTHGRLGRSWGCPALNKQIAPKVINEIKDGSIIFAYYPDKHWLQSSAYLNA